MKNVSVNRKIPNKKFFISSERLHLIAGVLLIISGALGYVINGIETALSWLIFGAMHISMSDIGEREMGNKVLGHITQTKRRFFGYFDAIFSLTLAIFFFPSNAFLKISNL